MTACTNPECTQLRDAIRADLRRAMSDLQWQQAELEERRRTVTLGGPPPPFTHSWVNRADPNALLPEYAHLAAPHGGTPRTTERPTP
jgi:hypothetical protein